MKKTLIIWFIIFAQIGYSQIDEPLIERKGNLVQNRYYILGREVAERQVVKKMKPFKAAHTIMKSSRRWSFTSSIIAAFGVGVFMPTFFDPSPEVTVPLLIAGVSLIAIAVPIKTKANRKADEAIDLYNSRQLMGKRNHRPNLNLVLNQFGVGLYLKF